ncbi:carbohydrate ABC transporter membrane protein 1 (CUT1 family) [Hungatella effluvii]|uniref:Carbohydrate ABC transporter membrane protein 1 (CUT1 family) n=1 Tax=Hungatella effluvii TaxID=1096246 RepID=A0A2V3YC73_9FIRM|nr:sugar ABC transporter permease [Hungatella effluvii]PXX49637.1 carbohydrate ABC transporter membrane protein 1 (CUT1 family) [Hungatella effluvii]
MHWFSTKKTKILMIAPAVILFLLYIIIPVFMAFYYGFTNFTGIGKPEFLGLRNYITLFSDKIFYIALKNTGLVLAMSLLLIVPCSFGLSLLFARKMRGGKLVKAFCFSPNIISPILIGLIWVFILDPKIGLINAFLRYIGVSAQPEWIGGKTLTPYCVGAIFLWQTLGYNATIFLAGIKMVPQELYEASEIDGAGKMQQLIYITFPMIRQTIIIVMLLVITGCFKIFEVVYQLTGGGPNHMSDLLVTYMYYSTFTSSRYGYGMSIASVTFLISALFAVIYLYVTREQVGEEE